MSNDESPTISTICIDGPTASGKGAVAQLVADRLGWHYLDSGAIYRLLALVAARTGLLLNDEQGLEKAAVSLDPRFIGESIWLAGEDVSTAIREPSVGNTASRIAVFPRIRAALLARQRAFLQAPGLVADGRDMATVVFPDAPLKVFLTADTAVRAKRRYKQLIEKGFTANLTGLQKDLELRDARDRNREAAPLKPAEDSQLLDSSDMDLDSVVNEVLALAKSRGLINLNP